jgi:hypothetical protein
MRNYGTKRDVSKIIDLNVPRADILFRLIARSWAARSSPDEPGAPRLRDRDGWDLMVSGAPSRLPAATTLSGPP